LKHGERLQWCRLADHLDDLRHNIFDACVTKESRV
jgi:hypothetical protein